MLCILAILKVRRVPLVSFVSSGVQKRLNPTVMWLDVAGSFFSFLKKKGTMVSSFQSE